MAEVSWRQLHDLKLGGVADYVEVWGKTNKKIDEKVSEANDVVEPGVKKAFGGMTGEDLFSDGATAAKDELTKLTGQLEDAKAEGLAIEDVVRGAEGDFKRIRDDFRDKVDEINGTTPDIDGAGSFSVDIDSQVVKLPTRPTGDKWNNSAIIDEWNKAYQPKADKFEEDLNGLIKDADEADEYATLLLKETSGDSDKPKFNGDPPDDLDPEVIDDGLPPKDATPEEVKDWWDSLSKDEQQYFIEHEYQKVGDLDGVPVTARDEANRIYLDERGDQIDKKLEEKRDELEERNRKNGPGIDPKADELRKEIEELKAEQRFLGQVEDAIDGETDNGAKHYLIDVDPKDEQAVIAAGNPDTADNTAVFVPGTTAGDSVAYQTGRADSIQEAASNADPNSSTAAVMWLGYDAPDSLPQASGSSYAKDGASELNGFMDSLRTTHQGPSSHTTVIGHSYGSTVVGTADSYESGLGADDVVLIGSPGAGYDDDADGVVTDASELATEKDHIWVEASSDDMVTQTELHGKNPAYEGFGGTNMHSGEGRHSDYWEDGSVALENQALVVTGKYDRVSTHGPRDVVEIGF